MSPGVPLKKEKLFRFMLRKRHHAVEQQTPIQVIARGAAAGLAATLLLSALSRVLPGLWNERAPQESPPDPGAGPEDPDDPESVRAWQAAAQAPAAHRPPEPPPEEPGGAEAITPAGALARPSSPGPEGLAEQLAFKIASGVFERDISAGLQPIGMATHLAYGSTWGALYGILRASTRVRPTLFGPLFGGLVYAIGPGWLVPAMKLMARPSEEPPDRTAMLIAGHVIYGAAVAEVFEALSERGGTE